MLNMKKHKGNMIAENLSILSEVQQVHFLHMQAQEQEQFLKKPPPVLSIVVYLTFDSPCRPPLTGGKSGDRMAKFDHESYLCIFRLIVAETFFGGGG